MLLLIESLKYYIAATNSIFKARVLFTVGNIHPFIISYLILYSASYFDLECCL